MLAMFPVYAEDVPPELRKAAFPIKCHACGGSGEVSKSRLEKMELGGLLRSDRKARGYGLRECAEALGIKASWFSKAEQGNATAIYIETLRFAVRELPSRILPVPSPPAAAPPQE